MFKGFFLDDQIIKAAGIENFANALEAKQRWVELNKSVERFFFQHVLANLLDFVWRAAVHRRQCDAMHQFWGNA